MAISSRGNFRCAEDGARAPLAPIFIHPKYSYCKTAEGLADETLTFPGRIERDFPGGRLHLGSTKLMTFPDSCSTGSGQAIVWATGGQDLCALTRFTKLPRPRLLSTFHKKDPDSSAQSPKYGLHSPLNLPIGFAAVTRTARDHLHSSIQGFEMRQAVGQRLPTGLGESGESGESSPEQATLRQEANRWSKYDT